MKRLLALLIVVCIGGPAGRAADRIPLEVEHAVPGAPLTVGIPFPRGALQSPDHVRLVDAQGEEVPAQVTQVTTWAPADPESVKWIWVFFFDEAEGYALEYGEDVRRAPVTEPRVRVRNNMRSGGEVQVDTGPLRFRVDQGAGGFLSEVLLDAGGDGFDSGDRVATSPGARGSFLDLVDDTGVDASRAVVKRTWVEEGSGPLHVIIRVEGVYRYQEEEHPDAPFTTRIHAYAGRSHVRVLHTFVYTGDPDKRPPLRGEHAVIATQPDHILHEDSLAQDVRVMQPKDRIAASGLALKYRLGGSLHVRTGYREGPWWRSGEHRTYETNVGPAQRLSVGQRGPDATGTPAPKDASPTERIGGFTARVRRDDDTLVETQKAEGWIDVRGARAGVGIGLRHFFEEYPSELGVNAADTLLTAQFWPSSAAPMSFARISTASDGGTVGNFARGLAKTTEVVYDFHDASKRPEAVERTLAYGIDPPVAHAPPAWYARSTVYGSMAPYTPRRAAYERGLSYKFDWWRFNQNWEPWYSAFDFGDGKPYFFGGEWYLWNNNEPATDFMWWLAFMRTGQRGHYLTAEAASRHAMDVDNTHWPAPTPYVGDRNPSLAALRPPPDSAASPYLGMGRRHGRQQWTAMLSAHVWVPGWLASYYLSGYHRGLEVAKQTADYYTRRIFGEHGLTGRRLYLSVWNLAEIWDATKSERYGRELKDRIDRMLRLQAEQGGSLVIDRYGYAQVYASHGLGKYLRMTGGDPEVRRAMVRHARRVRDVPPYNHGMESYLSTIHSLLLGYELSGEESLYRTAVERADVLRTDKLPGPDPFRPSRTQADLAEALEEVSHLPDESGGRPPVWKITNGLRVFGWTHAYNVPYLIYWLEREGRPPEGPAAPSVGSEGAR